MCANGLYAFFIKKGRKNEKRDNPAHLRGFFFCIQMNIETLPSCAYQNPPVSAAEVVMEHRPIRFATVREHSSPHRRDPNLSTTGSRQFYIASWRNGVRISASALPDAQGQQKLRISPR
jgi:hypothetical protein